MHFPNYPQGTVRQLLQTDLVVSQTKAALEARLQKPVSNGPKFFDSGSFEILKDLCKRLIPQEEHEPVDLAGILDEQLSGNRGNGWRYDAMPPDREAFQQGIQGIEAYAVNVYQQSFPLLPVKQQDEIITAVQEANTTGKAWENMPSDLFFEELLSRLCEIYYSHPLAKETIGDVSFADAHGWEKIGLNEKDPQEITPL